MLVSKLFSQTRKQDPAGEESINARWLARAGYIYKNMAGVYSYLPLGLRVLQNIRRVIREELNQLGAQEVYLNELQPKELWQKTGRWQELAEIMYQFKDSRGKEIGLATTHEEVVAEMASNFIKSYKDLPQAIFQIQDKFRDEPRARSGLLRGREFEMKDLYSFHADEKCLSHYYEEVKEAYFRIFKRLGLLPYLTSASGGSFTKDFSHEFQALAEAGEDTIFVCEQCRLGKNTDIMAKDEGVKCEKCDGEMTKKRSIEVGNIFKLGTKFSEPLGLYFQDKNGAKKPVIMASFGIGTGRVMGAIAEINSDQDGLVWNWETAPYKAYIINLTKEKLEIPEQIASQALIDDRAVSAGEKFADADLLGLPYRVVKSAKTGPKVEIKERKTGKIELAIWEEFVLKLKL